MKLQKLDPFSSTIERKSTVYCPLNFLQFVFFFPYKRILFGEYFSTRFLYDPVMIHILDFDWLTGSLHTKMNRERTKILRHMIDRIY